MKRIAMLLICAGSISAFAQSTPAKTLDQATKAQITALQEENANLKMQLATAKLNVLQQTAGPVINERNAAIKELETLHPGTHWDDRAGTLVPNAPPPAPAAPAAAPAAAPKK